QPARYFRSNVQLVRNQVDAPADKSTHGRLAKAVLMMKGSHAKVKRLQGVDGAGTQAFISLVESDFVVKIGFANLAAAATVENQAGAVQNRLHDDGQIFAIANRGADLKADSAQWCVVQGILARGIARLE